MLFGILSSISLITDAEGLDNYERYIQMKGKIPMPQHDACQLSLTQMLDPEYLANPYPLYHQLRTVDPVFWDKASGNCWIVTSYKDVIAGLREPRLSVRRLEGGIGWLPDVLKDTFEAPIHAVMRQILFLDPPDHTRLRGLISKAFTMHMVEQLRPRIQHIVDTLLGPAQATGQMEFISEFAHPLPAIVIAEMLGIPSEDRSQFTSWTRLFAQLLDGGNTTLRTLITSLQGIRTLMEYLRTIINRQRREPQDNLIQAMISAEEQGDMLSEDEILGNCMLLLSAGHGTTTHLLGNGLLALLRNPSQRQQLQQYSALMPGAVTELLRYDSPVQLTSRVAREDLRIRDKEIKAGQQVLFCLGAANHDPAQFAQPDILNLRRQENRHIAFGYGIHFCLGAPLARLEAEIAFETLLRRFPQSRLATQEVTWLSSQVFRGLNALPIIL